MQDLENNNWIILEPLENIYDMHANLNVITTLLKFNQFSNNISWIISTRYIYKSKFHVCYHFLDMKIPGEKSLSTHLHTSLYHSPLPLFGIGITKIKTVFVKLMPFLFL